MTQLERSNPESLRDLFKTLKQVQIPPDCTPWGLHFVFQTAAAHHNGWAHGLYNNEDVVNDLATWAILESYHEDYIPGGIENNWRTRTRKKKKKPSSP